MSETLTVLIVDDSAAMRRMIARAVSLSGVAIGRVLEAGNGQAALEILRAEDVDVLLTDLHMPVMDGMELLRRVAGDARWTNLVRVVISTDGSDPRRSEATDVHVSRYLAKPIRPEVMRDVLSKLSTIHP